MDLTRYQNLARELFAKLADWFTSPQFYFQAAAIAAAVFIAFGLAGQIRRRVAFFHTEPVDGPALKVRRIVYACRDLLFPLLAFGALSLAAVILEGMGQPGWLVLIAKSAALIYVFYAAINRFLKHPVINLARPLDRPAGGGAVGARLF